MKFDVLNKIADSVYQDILSFENLSIYHTKEWHAFLEETFDWKIKALIAQDKAGKTIFFMPFLPKRRLGLKSINICLPLSHRVGPIFNVEEEQFKDKLPLSNIEIHDEVNLFGLDLVGSNSIVKLNLSNFQCTDDIFKSFSKDSIQRKIKKAERSNIYVKKETSHMAFTDFFEMQLETRKRQGSLIYPNNFFAKLREKFSKTNAVHLYLAYKDEKPVAGIIFFHFNNIATYAYGASYTNTQLFSMGVNQIVMWKAIKRAYEEGIKTIDFGTTPLEHKSLLKYKLKWGGKKELIKYSYLNKDRVVNRKGFLFRQITSGIKMMPLGLYRIISPILLKIMI